MEVAYYHDESLVNYEQQSSPSSVGSACSTDIGVVAAISRPYPSDSFNKDTVLRGLNLDIGLQDQSSAQRLHLAKNTAASSEARGVSLNSHVHIRNTADQRQGNQQAARHHGVITAVLGNVASAHTLASPDINMLKLGSPDLERLISNNQHNGQYMHQKPTGVTREQEMYAQGFERELERIKSRTVSDPDIPTSAIMSENGVTESSQCPVITSGVGEHPLARQHHPYMSEQYYNHAASNPSMSGGHSAGVTIHHMSNPVVTQLKEEPPQTVPVMSHTPPPMSPIDLINQEMMKSERKRQRNRVAASKCRKRKLERISRLEDKVKNLKNQNMELSTNANILRQQVAELKSKVMAHVNSGCQLMMNQQQVNF